MSASAIEYRRKRVVALYEEGMKQNKIANVLDLSPPAVCEIIKKWKEEGEEFYKNRLSERGRKPKLTEAQKSEIKEIVSRSATEYGYENNIWTQSRVARVIKEKYNIDYHRDSIGRILKKLGLSFKQPTVKSRKQDPEKVKKFNEEVIPLLIEEQKKTS